MTTTPSEPVQDPAYQPVGEPDEPGDDPDREPAPGNDPRELDGPDGTRPALD